jgi:hypothetical protein
MREIRFASKPFSNAMQGVMIKFQPPSKIRKCRGGSWSAAIMIDKPIAAKHEQARSVAVLTLPYSTKGETVATAQDIFTMP